MEKLHSIFQKLFNFHRRKGTVRYMFSSVFSIALLLGAAALTSTDVSYVRLEASQTTIKAGDQFYIDVYAYAHVPVNAVDVTLEFDDNSVSVLGVDTGQSVLTIWTEEPTVKGNQVVLRGGTFRKGFITEHKIATVNMQAKKTGQSSFLASEVVLLAGDGQGTPVAVAESTNSNVNLYIYDQNTEPGSIGINVEIKIVTDINGDGKVTLQDVSVFMSAWSTKSRIFDFNSDGRMTFKDFSIILSDLFLK